MKRSAWFILAIVAAWSSSGCFIFPHPNLNPLASVNSVQPDKQLYNRAMTAMSEGKYTVSRLLLQTLINTYPDSPYLAHAKMAMGDSWYREGGVEGLAQADAQYRDFITFFPTMPEASEAQLKIAKIQYMQIQKPDRDPTHAYRAQRALRNFMLNYPNSPLRNQALELLRKVQEVLATRDYRIAKFYALQGNYRAVQSRLRDVIAHYPLFSKGDRATELLAKSYLITSSRYAAALRLERQQHLINPELAKDLRADAASDRQQAIVFLKFLVERYPVSRPARYARRELLTLHQTVPTPSAEEIAFNRREIQLRKKPTKLQIIAGILHSVPNGTFMRADRIGTPSLTRQTVADVLNQENSREQSSMQLASNATGGVSGQIQLENLSNAGLKPMNNSLTAVEGSDANDPRALPAVQGNILQAQAHNLVTPNQIDRQKQLRLMAAELKANVPDVQALQHKPPSLLAKIF